MPHGAVEWVEIPAKDMDRDPAFYEKVFGWKLDRSDPSYVMYQDTAGHVGGGFHSLIEPSTGGGPTVYVSVDSIDEALRAIEAAGGKTDKPRTLIDEQVGWWAAFIDPAGNRIALYENAGKGH